MKTIQINYSAYCQQNEIQSKTPTLLKDLYKAGLKDDSLFHFLYEPECVIIRIGSEQVILKVEKYLQDNEIRFEAYGYPDEGKYREEIGGIEHRNLDILLPIYHANSIAIITLNDADYSALLKRMIHCIINPKYIIDQAESTILKQLAQCQ